MPLYEYMLRQGSPVVLDDLHDNTDARIDVMYVSSWMRNECWERGREREGM